MSKENKEGLIYSMTLKYQLLKNGLKISSKARCISSDFVKWFLCQLTDKFDLYECKNGVVQILNREMIVQKITLDDCQIAELQNCYELNKIDDITFDEFLAITQVAFGQIYVLTKGGIFYQADFTKNKNRLAIIHINADGDLNSVWIECTVESEVFIKLVNEYNQSNLRS